MLYRVQHSYKFQLFNTDLNLNSSRAVKTNVTVIICLVADEQSPRTCLQAFWEEMEEAGMTVAILGDFTLLGDPGGHAKPRGVNKLRITCCSYLMS